MFSKLSFFVFLAPLVSALTLQAPTNPTSGGTITINWTTTSGDPSTFSLELTNPSFNNAIAIANNVDATLNTLTLTLPIVPADGSYTIQAVNIGNINQVFSETPIFSVAPTVSSSVSATTTATLSSGTGTATANSLPVASTSASTTGSSSTVTGLTTVSGTSTGTTTAAATTTSTAAAVSSRFALTNAGGYAVLILAAVAGAAAVAF